MRLYFKKSLSVNYSGYIILSKLDYNDKRNLIKFENFSFKFKSSINESYKFSILLPKTFQYIQWLFSENQSTWFRLNEVSQP